MSNIIGKGKYTYTLEQSESADKFKILTNVSIPKSLYKKIDDYVIACIRNVGEYDDIIRNLSTLPESCNDIDYIDLIQSNKLMTIKNILSTLFN